ncbi:hypothetical protein TURU_068385 [Turdus rufiventris]|nr:hypothetical protein TURU_068385 [Turdus rufiventris]
MATASPPASSSSSSPGSPPPRHHQEQQQQQQQPWQEPEPGSPGCSQLLAAPAPGTRCSRGHRELRELHCRGTPDSPGYRARNSGRQHLMSSSYTEVLQKLLGNYVPSQVKLVRVLTIQTPWNQRCPCGQEANGILGCIRRVIDCSRSRKVILSFYCALERGIWSAVSCSGKERDGAPVEMVKGLEHLLQGKAELGLFSLEKKRLKGDPILLCACREGLERDQALLLVPSNGTGGMGRN